MKKAILLFLLIFSAVGANGNTANAESASNVVEFTPNNEVLESSIQDTLSSNEEKETYIFELSENQKVDISIDSGDKTVILYLKNEEGENILYANNGVTGDTITDEIGLPKGKYTIEVIRRYSHQGDIPYELNLKLSDSSYYEIETNDTFETANPVLLNTTYGANSHMKNTVRDTFYEKDYFRFEVPNGGKYGIKVNGENATFVNLYDQAKNYVGKVKSYDREFHLEAGEYYLSIYNTNTSLRNQPYTIEINYLKFDDVPPNYWAVKEIGFLSDYNIVNGNEEGHFEPLKTISRYEAAVMIARALDLDVNNRPTPSFNDIPKNHWAYAEVTAVVDEGIFADAKKFNGQDKLTREQAAKILVEAYHLTGTTENTFRDVAKNKWSTDYILTLLANNVTDGFMDGTFRPLNPVTKAEFAVFLSRLIDERYKP